MQSIKPGYTIHKGGRHRLRLRNASDDIHPLHLHRHSFELTRIGGKSTAGVFKDVVMLGGFQELEFEFIAGQSRNDALSLSPAVAHGFRIHGAFSVRVG
jgi:FtsP/CotA-like multicopper oxidase with cupredoxin domain